MDVNKAKIQSEESIDKLKLILLVGEDFQSKEMIGYTCYKTSSMSTLIYLPFQEQTNGKPIVFHWSIPTDQYKT